MLHQPVGIFIEPSLKCRLFWEKEVYLHRLKHAGWTIVSAGSDKRLSVRFGGQNAK